MTKIDIICAWKDENFRTTLNTQQKALLPSNPGGGFEDLLFFFLGMDTGVKK
jgi:mersacidin/lichenicidin family type 2 lantibiotic